MMMPRTRSEWPTALGGFALGLLLALALVGLWVMFAGGSEESFELTAPRPAAADGGLVGSTYSGIAERLQQERRSVRPLRGDLTFMVADIVWQDPAGPVFVRAAEMRGRIDSRAARGGDIVVRGVSVRNADVYVEQNARREWNYKRVFARMLEDGDDGGRRRAFIVIDAAVQNSVVRVRTPTRAFRIDNFAASLPRLDLAGPQLAAPRAHVARATGVLVVNDTARSLTAEDGRFEFPTGRVDFSVGRVLLAGTQLQNVSGSAGGDLPGMGMRATGRVAHLRLEDVGFLSPRIPATGVAAFGFDIRPLNATTTEIQLAEGRLESSGSVVTGSATIRMADQSFSLEAVDARFDPLQLALVEQLLGDTLPYQGTVTGTASGTGGLISFDVATRLAAATSPEPFTTQLNGSVRLASGGGFEIRRLEANLRDAPLAALRAVMPGLPLRGTISGRVVLSGPPERAPLAVNVRLEMGSGIVVAEGRVDLTGTVPSYDLGGRLIAVNVQQLVQPAVPPVFVTASFTLVGSGSDPGTLSARARVDGRFTGWRSGPNDAVHLVARIENGTANIDTATVRLASMTGEASGSWRFVAPASGSLSYRLAFAPITPFGPFIPVIGDEDAFGNTTIAGTINGERGRIQVAGGANATNLNVGNWSAASIEGTYRLILGGAVPEITFDATATDLTTPTNATYQTTVAAVRLQSPSFNLDIKADRAQGGGIEIVADGRIPPTGGRELIVQRARLDIGTDNWSLTAPALISWDDPLSDLTVQRLELRKSDGIGLFLLEGRVLPLANADFRLETAALPIGDLQRLAGRRARVDGALTSTLTLRSIGGAPQFTGTYRLDGAVLEGVRFSQLSGDASYQGQTLVANASAVVDTAGALQLRAEVPMRVRFGEDAEFGLLNSGPVNVTLVSDSIALAPFLTIAPDLSALTGSMSADLRITGTIEAPQLGGTVAVRNASARVIALNQRFDSINAVVAFEGRRAVIQQFVARNLGTTSVSGTITFEDLTKPVLDLTARLDGMRVMGVENQSDAEVTGEARLNGPLNEAVLTGRFTVQDGYVPIPQVGNRGLDAELAQFEADLPREGEESRPPSFMAGLTIDNLRVTLAENLWFVMTDASARLAGDLTINKSGDDYHITGELSGNRGTYTLRAGPIIRRFEVVQANMRFLGGDEINPVIDITARRRVVDASGRQLDINVRIGGTMERPTLALASPDAAAIPQSELLSFLLFGRPSFAVGGPGRMGGEAVVGETFFGGISELLSIELEQAVIDELGMSLDVFQIRLGGGRLDEIGQPSLVLGEEIGSNLFLTVESGVGALFGSSSPEAATFAVRLEWRIGEHTVVRASREPVNQLGVLRGYSVALPPSAATQRRYQLSVELRRRWQW